MALASKASQLSVSARLPAPRAVPKLRSGRRSVHVAASAVGRDDQIAKLLAIPAAAGVLLSSGHAQAATELAQLAASDNRLGTIALLFAPAVAWVGFNMLQPLNNQLDRMSEMNAAPAPKAAKRRGVASAVGLGAALSLFAAQQAEAATEIAQLAASDNRLGTIALLFAPAVAWVGFNMLQPLNNQLDRMSEMNAAPAPKAAKRRGVASAVGLGAALSLFAAQHAEAATEVAQLAASDNRLGTIALLFAPAVAWVGFNMLQPLNNQLDRMSEMNAAPAPKAAKRRGVASAVGLGAALSLFAAQHAEAATEVAQLAASDNRLGTIALLFAPAVAWVGFNMLQPLNNQLDRMSEMNAAPAPKAAKRRGVASAVGLGAALSLFAAQHAEAATEVAQLAASDNRLGTIALLFAPAVAWVGFNMLQPLNNQLDRMSEMNAAPAPKAAKRR
ncbi:hypothetical protein MNEG_6079 [Monoraphidium neglectum]|uniref:Photosystem II PsbY protein n=1 Tax=Monoraphidium neglectum TaxID=145388 RepID=A0A0D2MFG5_9CHLO|nr:hypothetical protein MNEG_6079 [Monoraphidium neglectum]KIZ01880.1 hypothetical protein MNEG_6079 [Monoraphidium neglectum]|eukprot:XP_013900899.1 hypothetical protein MNEG_6079 [Monoraphidium neglectum]